MVETLSTNATNVLTRFLGWIDLVSGGNDMVSAVLVASVISLLYFIPKGLKFLGKAILNKYTYTTTITGSSYDTRATIKAIIDKLDSRSFSRKFTVIRDEKYVDGKWLYGFTLALGYGMYLTRIGSDLVFIRNQVMVGDSGVPSFTLEVKSTSLNVMNDIISKLNDVSANEYVEVFSYEDKSWTKTTEIPVDAIHEPIGCPDTLGKIYDLVDVFMKSEQRYTDYGLIYKLSLLLHGIPGTGKTSLARYIAKITNRPIYTHDLSEVTTLPLVNVLGQVPKGSLLLLEDIDTANVTHSRTDVNSEDVKWSRGLGGVLNSLDGIASMHDVIVIATTNHIERLDAALIRDGRFNHHIELPIVNTDIIRDKLERHYGDLSGVEIPKMTVSKLGKIMELALFSRDRLIEELDLVRLENNGEELGEFGMTLETPIIDSNGVSHKSIVTEYPIMDSNSIMIKEKT